MLRLKIENSGYSVLKSKRITDHFINRIGNQADFLQFYKKAGFGGGPASMLAVKIGKESNDVTKE